MGEHGVEGLGVLGGRPAAKVLPAPAAAAVGGADGEGHGDPTPHHVVHLRRLVRDLIVTAADQIDEGKVDDGP